MESSFLSFRKLELWIFVLIKSNLSGFCQKIDKTEKKTKINPVKKKIKEFFMLFTVMIL